jgi:cytoskeletal protein CcmA (bactofilin family)
VAGTQGVLVVREDTILRGEIRNCREVEIYGYVDGDLAADKVHIHKGGQCYGTVKTEHAEVHGTLQGDVTVKHLINIHSSGSVSGNVRYGRLAMELGGILTAEVKNVPPAIAGDLDLAVERGRSVQVTLDDLTAIDPDDDPKDLIFTVANATHGFVTLAGAPARLVNRFTQADLQNGRVQFRHDGSDSRVASFDVVVTDHSGATSGAPQTVKVAVKPGR